MQTRISKMTFMKCNHCSGLLCQSSRSGGGISTIPKAVRGAKVCCVNRLQNWHIVLIRLLSHGFDQHIHRDFFRCAGYRNISSTSKMSCSRTKRGANSLLVTILRSQTCQCTTWHVPLSSTSPRPTRKPSSRPRSYWHSRPASQRGPT